MDGWAKHRLYYVATISRLRLVSDFFAAQMLLDTGGASSLRNLDRGIRPSRSNAIWTGTRWLPAGIGVLKPELLSDAIDFNFASLSHIPVRRPFIFVEGVRFGDAQ